jgi:hypothetical protein
MAGAKWGWAEGVVIIVGSVVGFFAARAIWPKTASATPVGAVPIPAPSRPNPYAVSDALDLRVQQERRDELAQWYIVQRNAQHMVASLAASRSAGTGVEQQWRDTLANATLHITTLEREIAAHGG